MVRLQMHNNQYLVTVPSTKIRKKGWTKGKELDWIEYPNGDLILKEM